MGPPNEGFLWVMINFQRQLPLDLKREKALPTQEHNSKIEWMILHKTVNNSFMQLEGEKHKYYSQISFIKGTGIKICSEKFFQIPYQLFKCSEPYGELGNLLDTLSMT